MVLPSIINSLLRSQNTIIAKYLIRNVLVLLFAVFVVIGLVVFGNQLVLVVKESLKQGIPVADLLPLIGFKMIRDVPLILSLSLFFGSYINNQPTLQKL